MENVVLGLSGGVDSAVAATRLREMGYAVQGLFLDLGLGGQETAQRTADELGIPLTVLDWQQPFEQTICTYFARAFQQAQTPNPCILCNPLIKFRALTAYADEIGAAHIATGHYARIGWDDQQQALLLRSRSTKDQTYMMYRLSRETLARCIFPLGDAANKDEVRAAAREQGLTAADQPDSMDICFIPDGDLHGWLERHGAACPPGNFVDTEGQVLGQHNGLHCYTVGQRKGLGVASTGRLFVRELRPETNEVVLSLEDVYANEVSVAQTHYILPAYATKEAFACDVRVRFSQRSDRATVYPAGDTARVVFEQAVRAPTKGQSAVFYDGDIVIGGGFLV